MNFSKIIKKIFLTKKFFVIFLIFCFSVVLRVSTINKMGKGIDELFCPDPGIKFIQLYAKGDFKNKFWVINGDPPPLCRYVFGFVGFLDVQTYTKNHEPIPWVSES